MQRPQSIQRYYFQRLLKIDGILYVQAIDNLNNEIEVLIPDSEWENAKKLTVDVNNPEVEK